MSFAWFYRSFYPLLTYGLNEAADCFFSIPKRKATTRKSSRRDRQLPGFLRSGKKSVSAQKISQYRNGATNNKGNDNKSLEHLGYLSSEFSKFMFCEDFPLRSPETALE